MLLHINIYDMKKTLTAVVAAFGFVQAMAQQGGNYTVSGTIADTRGFGDVAYLVRYDDGKRLDSVRLDGKAFSFEGRVDTAAFCCIASGSRAVGYFILEPGDIKVNTSDEGKCRPSGTPMNDEMAGIDAEAAALNAKLRKAIAGLRSRGLDAGELNRQAGEFTANTQQYFRTRGDELFARHGNDALGEYLMGTDYMQARRDIDQMKKIGTFGPWLRSRTKVRALWDRIKAKRSTMRGAQYRDINGRDADGNPVKLSDYVGRGGYVLVDFWASWCGPCKREIPYLARLYKKYKDKGLTVVGVFVWDKEENLRGAMREEGIKWPQIVDTEGAARKKYGITGIPQIMLIGPDGKIAARDLRGERMVRFVEGKLRGE